MIFNHSEHLQKLVLAQHGHAELLRFFELGAASSPATTKSVFFDTEPVTLPPCAVISSVAACRPMEDSVPVSTTVLPANSPPSETLSHPLLQQSIPQPISGFGIKEGADRCGDDAADIGDGKQLLFRCSAHLFQ